MSADKATTALCGCHLRVYPVSSCAIRKSMAAAPTMGNWLGLSNTPLLSMYSIKAAFIPFSMLISEKDLSVCINTIFSLTVLESGLFLVLQEETASSITMQNHLIITNCKLRAS